MHLGGGWRGEEGTPDRVARDYHPQWSGIELGGGESSCTAPGQYWPVSWTC